MTHLPNSKPELKIEALDPTHIPELASFAVQAYSDTYGYEMSPLQTSVEEMSRAVEFRAAADLDTILVARMGKRIAGYVQFGGNEEDPGDVKELRKLYVAKQLHGSGVGPRLLEEALADPVLKFSSSVYLWVWGENGRAIRFYEKYDFVPMAQRRYMSGGRPTFDLAMIRMTES